MDKIRTPKERERQHEIHQIPGPQSSMGRKVGDKFLSFKNGFNDNLKKKTNCNPYQTHLTSS